MTPESGGQISNEDVLTVTEVATELRCSKAHVYHAINGQVRGVPALPAIRMGRRRLIRRSSLEHWKSECEAVPLGGAILPPSPEVHAVGRIKGNEHA
jgi:excisionase family DNA binding protein